MSLHDGQGGRTSGHSPHHDDLSHNHAELSLLSSLWCQKSLQCPVNRAPRCFKTVLVRCLELGAGNFIPTNWRGFSDYFRLQELKARGAEELVEAWADRHPYKHEHTLLKVAEYAQSARHVRLLQHLEQTLKDHIIPDNMWTHDPADCFKTCRLCVPLLRSNSRSSDDIHSDDNPIESDHHTRRHKRSHSLPKDIQITPRYQCHCSGSHTPCHTPCSTASGVTNIFHMSCCCSKSPLAASPSTPLTHHCTSPTSSTRSCEDGHIHPGRTDSVRSSMCESAEETFISTASSPQSGGGLYVTQDSVGARHRIVSDSGYACTHMPHAVRKILTRTHSSTELLNRGNTVQCQPSASDDERECTATVMEGVNSGSWGEEMEMEGVNSGSGDEEMEMEEKSGHEREDGSLTNNLNDRTPLNQGTGVPVKKMDVMQEFGRQLFDTPPYNLVRRFYNIKTREVIILILASFFLYNGLRCILQTMCEDGGFHKVFTNADTTLEEATRRIAIFYIRMLTVVISPLCFCIHISAIASKPTIPKTSFSEEAAIQRMMVVHRKFSPHYEVKFIQNKPQSVFKISEVMTKRHISSIWLSILNSLLKPTLVSYIGGVTLVCKNFTEGGVCKFFTVSIIHVPVLDLNVHLLMVLDLLLALGVVMCIHMLKDYYYYENRIAVFAVTAGGEAKKLYQEIRRRWVRLDCYCYVTAVAIVIVSYLLASVDRTIIPDPSSPLQPEDLLNWFFWISVLSVVDILGMSPNRLVKKTSIPAYLLVVILFNVVNLRVDAIPPESLVLYFLVGTSCLVINLLLSLCSCHYYHFRHTRSTASLFFLVLSLALLLLLPLANIGVLYREIVHLAAFVR